MNYLSSLVSLDDLSTPVIICNGEGIVTYKNKMAMKEIRLPRRNTHISRHVLSGDRAEFAGIGSDRSARVVGIDTGDRAMRAFVVPYKRKGEQCTLWVFVSLIQVRSSDRYTYQMENDIAGVALKICSIVKSIDENSLSVKSREREAFTTKMLEKIKKVVSYIFYNGNEVFFPVSKSLDMLVSATEQTFTKFGYDIKYSVTKETDNSMIDIRSFSLLFFHLMAFFAECGAHKSMNVDITPGKQSINMKLTLTMPYPPFYEEGSGDVMKLAELSPSNIVDVMIFDRMCEIKDYKFSYSINEDHLNNVNVFIDIPTLSREKLRDYFSGGFGGVDEELLPGVITAIYFYQLVYRCFDAAEVELD